MAFLRCNRYGRPPGNSNFIRNCSPYPTVSGYEALGTTLTINGADVDATFVVYGSSAANTWTPAVGADDFTLGGTGSDPTYSVAGDYGDGVTYASGNKYHASPNASYNVTVNDVIIEAVYKHTDAANQGITGDYLSGRGIYLATSTSGRLYSYTRNGATAVQVTTPTSTLTDGNWHHVMMILDRDEASTNGQMIYVDGVFAVGGDCSALDAVDLSNVTPWVVGRNPDSGATFTGTIGCVAMWTGSEFMPGGATNKSEFDSIAAARYATLTA